MITSVVLTGGDASGANVGIGFKDSSQGSDLFRIRLNKTSGGLVVSTFFDSTYTVVHTFYSCDSLSCPLKVISVVDLYAKSAYVDFG